jgi:thiol-disulfide isomerase/thioredoxin
MTTLSTECRVPVMMKVGICGFCLLIGSTAGRLLAEDSLPLPRYRLVLGQELQYHGQSDFKYGKDDNVATMGDDVECQAWVVGANADGGWRVVIRSTTKSWSSYGKDGKRSEEPLRSEMVQFDLNPDGRVSCNESFNPQLQPETLFPRLPADSTAMARGWEGEREDGFAHLEFKVDVKTAPGKAWVFDEISHSLFDKIYLSSAHSKYTFDMERGLVARADSENAQGNVDGKGTETTELVTTKNHDEAWTKRFADAADRYFKAHRTYRHMLTAANGDAKNAEETLAKAETVLKEARAELKDDVFGEQLDRQLVDHKNQAHWALEDAKKIAECKDKPAAEWKLDDLDGKSHSLAHYRGKVVVLDFWYRGCGWCIRAMPQIEELADDFKNESVAVLGMNTDREAKNARFVVEAMHLTYPVLRATDVPTKYGVSGFPTFVVIDKNGIVRDVHAGYSKTLRADISKIVKDLLATK